MRSNKPFVVKVFPKDYADYWIESKQEGPTSCPKYLTMTQTPTTQGFCLFVSQPHTQSTRHHPTRQCGTTEGCVSCCCCCFRRPSHAILAQAFWCAILYPVCDLPRATDSRCTCWILRLSRIALLCGVFFREIDGQKILNLFGLTLAVRVRLRSRFTHSPGY